MAPDSPLRGLRETLTESRRKTFAAKVYTTDGDAPEPAV